MKSSQEIDTHVGARVRAARIEAKFSQEKLAEALDLTFQQIQKYEKASNRLSIGRLLQIADILGKAPSWFYEGAPGRTVPVRHAPDLGAMMLANSQGRRMIEAFLAVPAGTDRQTLIDVANAIAGRAPAHLQAAE